MFIGEDSQTKGLKHGNGYAYVYTYTYAYTYLKKNPKFFLKVLNLIAECGLDALKEMKSPGCKFLSLTK